MAMNIFKELEKGNLPGLKRAISLYPNAVNVKNAEGATPLHVAAGLGQAAFVKELLVHGGHYDTTDNHGNIPLHLAAEQGSDETVGELLTGRKASAKAKNKEGQTALHLAVLGGHKGVVLKLLEANNRTDLKDKAGNTPLSLAGDEEMRHILISGKPPSTGGGQGTPSNQRGGQASGIGNPSGSTSGRFSLPSAPPSLSGSDGGGAAVGTLVTPRAVGGGSQAGGRTPPPSLGGAPGPAVARTPPPGMSGTPSGSFVGRLPRSSAGNHALASPAISGGGAGAVGANGPAATVQHQKYDMAIQSLKESLRAATERLGALDACTTAQLECAGQVEKALETCGTHGRAISDLETRVAFQEERSRDVRVRLDRLEDGERDRQDSMKRLADDNRSLGLQLQRLADQVAIHSNGAGHRMATSTDIASHIQAQHQLQAEVAVLRAQLDQLSPALPLATAATAEARTLAARVDVMQQQQQQQHIGGNVVAEQQVLQLQAQVQLLQLPVASLTQQCTDLSSRMAGLMEWQQQARGELARMTEAMEQSSGDKLTDAVMSVLDTTARSLNELRQQQDETARQVALLLQQQQATVPPSPSPSIGPPTLPATPQGGSQRLSGAGDPLLGLPGGAPSRNLNGVSSHNSTGRDAVAQAEVRSELESLKSLVVDIRKELATEGGSLRREWQRAFSDMQSRYGEQTNELRAREANIAKLREAALVEEAERRAASGFEEKFSARLGKLETNVEYLTHRLEVLEEQVSGVLSTLAGATSPVTPISPSRMAAALAAMRGQPGTSRSGPGPVSENHRDVVPRFPDISPTVAMVQSVLSPASPLKHGRCRSSAGPGQTAPTGKAAVQSDGGFLRRRVQLVSAAHGCSSAGESTTASQVVSAREVPCSARNVSEQGLGPEEWWRAANGEPSEKLEEPADAPAAAEGSNPPNSLEAGSSTPVQSSRNALNADTSTQLVVARNGAAASPRPSAFSHPGDAALGQLSASAESSMARPVGGAVTLSGLTDALQQVQPYGRAGHAAPILGVQPEDPPPQQEVAAAVSTQREPASLVELQSSHGSLSGRGLPTSRGYGLPSSQPVPPGVGGGILDPANVALGSQLLTPVAHALLTPSVDIQRLAAAAAAAQQQHQQQLYTQYFHEQAAQAKQPAPLVLPPWGDDSHQLQLAGNPAVGVALRVAEDTGGTVGPGRPAAAAPAPGPKSRKEPPMCLFCPMQ
ncbi:hypothetical protein Vretimale_19435 [Volvox reticuliferus]|uniref:Uncharacterized protein n=1 Tax=Volvox reticuliferus TaxID=1737510 RepID=A0A8J4FW25_9CHLO|nr:hypothetical protein Vretifemale_20196 [Volvox reticuliferus]GIM16852.1 hypothetical protein Vretimale_19435 [Volvox reticuliferus]